MKSEDFERFRDVKGLKQCIRCHTSLEGVNHHLYCDECWRYKRLDELATNLNRLFRKTRLGGGLSG